MNNRPQHRPCTMCGQKKSPDNFYWYPYTTSQGKASIRRESRCKECAQQRRRDRYAKDPSKEKMWSDNWKTLNNERMLARQSEYKRTVGKAICNASNAKRQAAQLQRTVAWADLNEIQKIYDKATASGLTVDHILPMQGEYVSGLHVPENLRLLSKSENSSKKNRFAVL